MEGVYMYVNKTILALFKDADDESMCSPLMAGIPDIIRVRVGDNVATTLENLKRIGIEPCLSIISSRLYPAEKPDLIATLRTSFPATEILLLTSTADPFPPLQPLAADMVRHLAINPVSPWNREKDETKDQFCIAIRKLVEGRPWKMSDYLNPGTQIRERHISSSTQKEELIAMVETAIGGESADIDLLRQRGALLADEMLENAMYGAPRRKDGSKVYRKGEERAIASHERIAFRFAFDGEVLAMEVADGWGSLSPDMVLKYLASNHSGGEMFDEAGGRGLFIIWRILDHFHISITPGMETVVGGHIKATSPFDIETPRGFHISTISGC
jgi:hypothetical protein